MVFIAAGGGESESREQGAESRERERVARSATSGRSPLIYTFAGVICKKEFRAIFVRPAQGLIRRTCAGRRFRYCAALDGAPARNKDPDRVPIYVYRGVGIVDCGAPGDLQPGRGLPGEPSVAAA